MDSVLEQLQLIFQDVLDLPGLVITRKSNMQNVEYWDSLTHIHLVMAVEKHFKIRFSLREMQELKKIDEMVELIHKKLGSA